MSDEAAVPVGVAEAHDVSLVSPCRVMTCQAPGTCLTARPVPSNTTCAVKPLAASGPMPSPPPDKRGSQGAVSFDHPEHYLDEFTFRVNRRASRFRGKLFERLLKQAVALRPAPYKALVGGGEPWWNSDHQIQGLLESTK